MSEYVWRNILIAMSALGMLFVCVVAYALIIISRDRPLPFRYTDISPTDTYSRSLCPGDLLQFDLEVAIHDAPGVVAMVENWQSQTTILADATPLYFIQEAKKTTRLTRAIPVPELTPGLWTYERAATVAGVPYPALIQIPLEIKENCS